MIAVDTDLLVSSHRRAAPWHRDAVEVVRALVEGRRGSWALPWPRVRGFLASLLGADRDLGAVPGLRTRNPLVATGRPGRSIR